MASIIQCFAACFAGLPLITAFPMWYGSTSVRYACCLRRSTAGARHRIVSARGDLSVLSISNDCYHCSEVRLVYYITRCCAMGSVFESLCRVLALESPPRNLRGKYTSVQYKASHHLTWPGLDSGSIMNTAECGLAADRHFGPAVAPCRREFDFTLYFEDTILSIVPATTFAALAIASLVFAHLQMKKAPTLVHAGILYPLKLCCTVALAAAQLAILVLQTREPTRTAASIASAAIALATTSVFLPLVSHVDHFKSRRPSSLLTSFLALTCLLDAARTRTYWLIARDDNDGNATGTGLAIAQSVSVGIRLVLLFLEAKNKKDLLVPCVENEKLPAEVLAGPINRTVFHWLNGLLLFGYRNMLQATDFGPIDDRLLSARLRPRFKHISARFGNANLQENTTPSVNQLIYLSFASLGRFWAGPIIARLAVTAFSFTQPFLANAALTYLQSGGTPEHPLSLNYGYGLIGATVLCYVGIAAATSWYWHQAYRCAVMLRGGLSVTIFDKVLKLPESSELESKATTLIVNDVERVMRVSARGHEFWAGFVEAGIATWLLYRQLGPSCFVMIGVTLGRFCSCFPLPCLPFSYFFPGTRTDSYKLPVWLPLKMSRRWVPDSSSGWQQHKSGSRAQSTFWTASRGSR